VSASPFLQPAPCKALEVKMRFSKSTRDLFALAHLVDVDDMNPDHFRTYQIDGDRWLGFDHAPEWACNHESPWYRYDVDYITVLDLTGVGCLDAPDKARGKRKVFSYIESERPCPWCGDGIGEEEGREDCDLCEGEGLLYQGEIVCHVYELTGE
jgi:hypothetical protein